MTRTLAPLLLVLVACSRPTPDAAPYAAPEAGTYRFKYGSLIIRAPDAGSAASAAPRLSARERCEAEPIVLGDDEPASPWHIRRALMKRAERCAGIDAGAPPRP